MVGTKLIAFSTEYNVFLIYVNNIHHKSIKNIDSI